jgi:uncharacterized protein YcfJ
MNHNNVAGLVIAAVALGGCAWAPIEPVPPPPPSANLTKVYFYPTQGQSEAQQDRDRYDCYVWSVDQTGFDPARRIAPREARASVVPAPSPGETIATAAAVGAVIGAVASDDVGKGAVVGALAGSVVGSAAASAQQQEARAIDARHSQRGYGRYEREAAEYRRAMSACLEGRGYSVR